MSSVFEEVALSWAGQEFIVPPDKVMGLVEVVEDIITVDELVSSGIKRAKVSRAFAAAIRYAASANGKQVVCKEQDVYSSLFGGDAMRATTGAVSALLTMMIPPEHLRQSESTTAKTTATRKPSRSKATGTSKKRI